MISNRKHDAEVKRVRASYERMLDLRKETIEQLSDELDTAIANLRIAQRDNRVLDDRLVAVLELLDAMPKAATTISIRRVRVAATATPFVRSRFVRRGNGARA